MDREDPRTHAGLQGIDYAEATEMNAVDARELARLLSSFRLATGLGARYIGASGEMIGEGDPPCCLSGEEGERCRLSILDAGRQAARFGEPYIAECHAGYFVIAAPILLDEEMIGAVECGPVNIGGESDELTRPADAIGAWNGHRPLSGSGVRAAADLLFMIVQHVARSARIILRQRKEMADQQAMLGEMIQAHKLSNSSAVYPMEMERALVAKMRLGDRSGARSILNQLLGRIFYATGDVDVIKARVLELAVILSRSAAEQGDAQQMLGLNQRYIRELSEISNYEDVCAWVVVVLDSYLDAVAAQRGGRSTSVLEGALAFIRSQYSKPLTLELVAGHVHISPFYLAHLMKQNLGYTFTEYLTRVRVEEARVLLSSTHRPVREIALSVGYSDAGYFSRVFQKSVGMTPSAFRKFVMIS